MDDDIKQTFITECYELIEVMEERLLNLEEGSTDLEALNAIFRGAHSIKGGAGALGFTEVYEFTHIQEMLLDAMREKKVVATSASIDVLLSSVDVVKKMIAMVQAGESITKGLGADVVKNLLSFTEGGGNQAPTAAVSSEVKSDTGPSKYKIYFCPHAGLFTTGNEPLLVLKKLTESGKVEIIPDLSKIPSIEEINHEQSYISWNIKLETSLPEAEIKGIFEFVEGNSDLTITKESAAAAQPAKPAEVTQQAPSDKPATPTTSQKSGEKEAAPAAVSSIRVDVDKVDRMVNMIGELVITQSMLGAQAKDIPEDKYPKLIQGLDELSRHTRELQEAVMAVRMQPVKSLFSRMPRLVRDLSKQLNKKVELVTAGEATEVDKTIIEQLSDPLTHMIRNSVDHGIELPDVRAKNGKPEEGTVRLSASHSGGKIIIEVADDGGGINRERVLRKAKEKGLMAADANPSIEEIDNIIFLPGFSTAEQVSNVSGRGVGMDVVRRNIEDLGGSVVIKNRPGEGSTFTLLLPLTLAILDGMIVRSGKEKYIVPISGIIETLQPRAEQIRTIADGNDLIIVREEFIPLLYLYRVFDVNGTKTAANDALVVILESGRNKFGLVVDELIGQQQVVIKNLENNAEPIPGVSGATILGDGEVSLILDVLGLFNMIESPPENASNRALKVVA